MLRTGRRAAWSADGLVRPRAAADGVAGPTAPRRAGRRGDGLDALLPLRSGGSRPPLFCLHHSTGLAWCYAALLGHLPEDLPVYGLQSPGFADRRAMADSVDAMVADYVDRIRSVQPEGPYQLLGWSFGAVLAQAIAVELERQGQQVALLALLDGFPGGHHRDSVGGPEEAGEGETGEGEAGTRVRGDGRADQEGRALLDGSGVVNAPADAFSLNMEETRQYLFRLAQAYTPGGSAVVRCCSWPPRVIRPACRSRRRARPGSGTSPAVSRGWRSPPTTPGCFGARTPRPSAGRSRTGS